MNGLERIAISVVSVFLLAAPGYKAPGCGNWVADFPASATSHTIDVEITHDTLSGECVASTPKPGQPGYEIRTSKLGDTINWRFLNNCSRDLNIGLGNFRATRKDAAGNYEPVDNPLTVEPNSLSVRAMIGGPRVTITAQTKATINHHGRTCATTYVYDIEEILTTGRQLIADPQIEVPR